MRMIGSKFVEGLARRERSQTIISILFVRAMFYQPVINFTRLSRPVLCLLEPIWRWSFALTIP